MCIFRFKVGRTEDDGLETYHTEWAVAETFVKAAELVSELLGDLEWISDGCQYSDNADEVWVDLSEGN